MLADDKVQQDLLATYIVEVRAGKYLDPQNTALHAEKALQVLTALQAQSTKLNQDTKAALLISAAQSGAEAIVKNLLQYRADLGAYPINSARFEARRAQYRHIDRMIYKSGSWKEQWKEVLVHFIKALFGCGLVWFILLDLAKITSLTFFVVLFPPLICAALYALNKHFGWFDANTGRQRETPANNAPKEAHQVTYEQQPRMQPLQENQVTMPTGALLEDTTADAQYQKLRHYTTAKPSL